MTDRVALLDIEGTLSSLTYVAKGLFPYARQHLPDYVARHAADPVVRRALEETRLLGEPGEDPIATLLRWMDEDRKVAPLKRLQGAVWDAGYATGVLKGHIFPDALAALRRWNAAGVRCHVYSSGSAHAQIQFFRHSPEGDLTQLFGRHFDLATGAKTEAASYLAIAEALDINAAGICFFSDNPRELAAARLAGLGAVQVVRETTVPDPSFPCIASFDVIDDNLRLRDDAVLT